MTRRSLFTAVATFLAGGLVALSQPGPVHAQTKQQPLTCSFIAQQCLKECPKQASEPFCDSYCNETRKACLRTGSWDGIARQFSNVVRK